MSDNSAVRSVPVLIQMTRGDGPLVQVTMNVPEARMMSHAHVAKVVSSGFENVMGMLQAIVKPFSETWKELSKDVTISESTLKLSLGVTAEGNFFVTKGTAEANIEIEVKLTPR